MTFDAIKAYLMMDIIDAFGDVSPRLYNALLSNSFQTVAHLYALDKAAVKKHARCYEAALENELDSHMEKRGFRFGALHFPHPERIVDLSLYQGPAMFMPLAQSGFADKAEIEAAIVKHGVLVRDEDGNSLLKKACNVKGGMSATRLAQQYASQP